MSDYIEIKWPSHVITNAKPSGDQVMVLKGMSVVKGDSSFDIAVRNGYVGTEAKWNTELNDLTTFRDEAQTAANTATNKADEAKTANQSAISKAQEAAISATSAQTAKDLAQTAATEAQAIRDAAIIEFIDPYFSALNLPTPDRSAEAVITPSVTTPRATYDFTKQGEAYRFKTLPGNGNGVYFPSRSLPFPSDAYRDRRFSYFSPDHGNARSGIYLAVCVDDPSIPTNWRLYEDAVAAGWLDDIDPKPATNPIWYGGGENTGSEQTETPCVVKVGNMWVITFQVEDGFTNDTNQATLRGVSTDGVNWTGTSEGINSGLTIDAIGDGHTGYLSWNKNLFENVINPATGVKYLYVGYSLIGGQNRSTLGFWGNDNPISAPWDFISAMNKVGGRASPNGSISNRHTFAFINADMSSAKVTRQGVSIICAAAARGAGPSARDNDLYEVLMDHDGLTMIGKPKLLMSRGPTGSIDEGEVGRTEVSIYSDKVVAVYTAASGDNYKVAAIATSPIRNAQNTYFDGLFPQIPPGVVTRSFEFRGATELPAGLEEVKAGTVLPAASFSETGLSVTVDGTQTVKGEYFVFDSTGIDLEACHYVEVYLEGWKTTSATAFRVPYIGFATKKQLREAQTDALFLSNGEGGDGRIAYQAIINGDQPKAAHFSDYYYGVGYGSSVSGLATVKKNVGIRYFPRSNRAFFLGEGGVEVEELLADNGNYVNGFQKAEPLYAFFGLRGAGTPTTESFDKLTVKVVEAYPVAGDASAGAIANAGSSTDASSYQHTSVAIGTAAATRKVAVWVGGRSTSNTTPSVTITPSGASPIAMTLAELETSSYDALFTQVGLFVADVPTGTTATIDVTVTGGVWQREGMILMPLYDVADKMPVATSTQSKRGTAGGFSCLIEKYQGGLTAAAAVYSLSSSTLITGANERTSIALPVDEITLNTSTNSTAVTWGGLVTQVDGLVMEGTRSDGGAIIVASWERA